MTLIVLYCLATLLCIVQIEPFTAIGAFISICFLPGLSAFALSNKDKILFEELILAFPYSIGISGLLTLGMLFIGVPIKYVSVVIYIVIGILILSCLILNKKNNVYPDVLLDKEEIKFIIFTLVMVLIMSIPYFIGPNRDYIAPHAFHHSSFVSQILNGIFPPENPGLGGTMIGYYWGFHALVAAIAVQTDFHHIQIIFTLNAVSLFIIFCIAYSFGKAFGLSEGFRYIMPLAVIGLMRTDIGIFFISKLISGSLISLEYILAHHRLSPPEVFGMWLKGLPWDDTRLFFLNKFYNISAMPTAICLGLSYLLMILSFVKKKVLGRVYQIGLYFLIAACIIIYPPLAIVPLLHAPVWSFYIFISSQGNYREKVREALIIFLPYAIAILSALPYLLFIMASRDVSSSGQGSVFSFDFYSQSIKNLVVFLIPSPLIIYGFWSAFRKFSFSREFVFLLIGTGLCLGLSAFTRWPFNNSYKFNYILIIFFALFVVLALAKWLPSFSRKLVACSTAALIILLLLSSPIIIEAAYIVSCLSMEKRLTFSKGHLAYAQDEQKNQAYKWLRENTPPNSLLMLSYIETSWPCCGLNHNYGPAAFAERTLYVTKDTDYTVSNPEYAKRVLFREKLFENTEDPAVINYFLSLNRPVYLLIEDNLNTKRFFVEDRFENFPEDPGNPFELVFHNNNQRIYLLQFKKK